MDTQLIELTLIFLLGAFSFFISTLTGGGGAMVLLPIISLWLGSNATAPILNLGTSIGRPARLVLFWKHINWSTSVFYIPTALIGVYSAGDLMIQLPKWIFQIIIGLFLISTIFQYKFGKKKKSFNMKRIYFLPLGLIIGFVGTLTGGLGPVLNPFYFNAGLEKEELIATKTANSFFVGVGQVITYIQIGVMDETFRNFGIALGIGIILGNIFGKRALKKVSTKTFNQLFLIMMVVSGIVLFAKGISSI